MTPLLRATTATMFSEAIFDSGSTTIKIAVVAPDGKLLDSFYQSNKGNPVVAVRDYLSGFYEKYPNCKILAAAVTGYGEELIKHAFHADYGIVETMAHFIAAKSLLPEFAGSGFYS